MQGTLTAARIACSAILLSVANNQGMEFIIQRRVDWKAALKDLPYFLVTVCRLGQAMSLQHTPRVGVHNEYGMLARIEQDSVCGLRPDAVDAQKLLAQQRRWGTKHSTQRTAVLGPKKTNKTLQFLGFLAKIARGTNKLGQSR
jgi:hypothetical protein